MLRFADIWKVRIGVLVARGGVSEELSTRTFAGKAVSVLEFGGGIDMSMTISVEEIGRGSGVEMWSGRTVL